MPMKAPDREAWIEYRERRKVLADFCHHIASKYGWSVVAACLGRNKVSTGFRDKRRSEMLADLDIAPFSGDYSNTSYYFSAFMEALAVPVQRFRTTLKDYFDEPPAPSRVAGASEDAVSFVGSLMRDFSSYNFHPNVSARLAGPYGPTTPAADEILVRPSYRKVAERLGISGARGDKAINYCVEGKLIIDINTIRNINRKNPSDEDREYIACNVIVVERFRTDKRRGYQYRVVNGHMVVHKGFKARGFSSHSELGALRACKTLVTKQIDKTLTGSVTA